MRTSENGVNLIKRFEGLELEAYQDIAGIWTIGYGHTGPDVEPGMKISERDAEELLRRDLKPREQAVAGAAKVPLNQNEFDALVSFVYNVGAAALRGSTALKRLNRGDRFGAAEALTWWNKAAVGGVLREVLGLTRRRATERALFLTPTAPPQVRNPEAIDENTRIPAVEESPRRGNVAESRTVQGAAVAGGAGVASSTMGRDSADKLDKIETNIETGQGMTEKPVESGGGVAQPAGDAQDPAGVPADGASDAATADGTSDAIAADGASDAATSDVGDAATGGETGEMIEIPDRPSKHEAHAVEAQVQFALLILIILAVLFVIYARIDDWFHYKR